MRSLSLNCTAFEQKPDNLYSAVVQRLETRDSTIVGRTESVPACIASFGQILNAAALADTDKM